MAIRSDLVEILVDPATKVSLEELSREKLALLNAQIGQQHVKDAAGNVVKEPVAEALITTDGATVYRVDGGIPIMLAEQGLPTSQIEGF